MATTFLGRDLGAGTLPARPSSDTEKVNTNHRRALAVSIEPPGFAGPLGP